MNKAKKTEFLENPDNVEFIELIVRFSNLGLQQQEIAEVLGVSAGQVSRVKNGERHASVRHLRKLRKHVRQLTDARNSEPTLAPKSLSDSAFGMTHTALRTLSVVGAVRAFRDLLWARATSRGFPTTRVSISENVYAADGGVDASILDGTGNDVYDDLLTTGTRYQIKTGDFAPWQKSQINTELFGKSNTPEFANLGSAIQEALRNGNRLVFVCFGIDPLDRDIRKAKNNLKEAFKTCGYPNANVEVWGQNQLIRLFESYPSLCLRLRGHVHQGFRSHNSWSDDSDMQPVVRYSPEQDEVIKELCSELRSCETPHVRLIGEPGVGKTRLALEITRDESLAPVTLYVRDGRSFLQSTFINELVQSDDDRFALFVIDECPLKDLADIWNMLKPKADRLRAITIDHGPDRTVDDKIRVLNVEPSGNEQIVAILMDHNVGENDAKRWADYCEGCPRVAHVFGANLTANSADLLASPSITEVWRRFTDGYDAPESEGVLLRRIVLHCAALFERFGFERPVSEEAQFIQKLAERYDHRITQSRFRTIINELKGRRIIQGNTTLYLTPRLLHIHLNREFWQLYGSDFDLATIFREMPSGLWDWFMGMLRYTHDVKSAEKAIDGLLGPAGIFRTGQFPDTQHSGRMISVLAETCPKKTLRCLRRTIGEMDASSLRSLSKSRQWLVWTLEKLAVWEDCFVEASEMLLDLAETENSTNSNNATGTFTGLYSLIPGWAPTQASPSTRLKTLVSALDSDASERRRIGLRACANALSIGPANRMVGPEHQGLRQTISFWMPETYGELWDAYRDVWKLLLERLSIWQGDDRRMLISTIIETACSTLNIQSLTHSVVETLRSFASDTDTDVKSLVTLLRRQLRRKEGKLPDDVKAELQSIYEQLDGRDFQSKLSRFVKHVSWEDYHDNELNETHLVDKKLDELAVEVNDNPTLLISELPWLVCEDSGPAYSFAFRISKQDLNRSMLPTILEEQSRQGEASSTSFLSGYLAGIFERDKEEWEFVMIEISRAPATAGRFSDFVISSGMSDGMAKKVIEQCRYGLQKKDRLEHWWFTAKLQGLNADIINELIGLQFEDAVGALWSNAVHMCHAFYMDKGSEQEALPENLTFRLLTAQAMADGRSAHSAGYYWSRLARAFIDQFPQRKWEFLEHVLRAASKNWSVLCDLDTNEEQVLTCLLRDDPDPAWECIVRIYCETKKEGNFGLRSWLAEGGHQGIGDEFPGPIQHIRSEVLFDWADEDPKERGYWLTHVLPKTLDDSTAGRLTRNFVARFGKNKSIRQGLTARFYSRSWRGNESDHYRILRNEARDWMADEKNPTVVRWIEDYIEGLGFGIERAEIDEEREH